MSSSGSSSNRSRFSTHERICSAVAPQVRRAAVVAEPWRRVSVHLHDSGRAVVAEDRLITKLWRSAVCPSRMLVARQTSGSSRQPVYSGAWRATRRCQLSLVRTGSVTTADAQPADCNDDAEDYERYYQPHSESQGVVEDTRCGLFHVVRRDWQELGMVRWEGWRQSPLSAFACSLHSHGGASASSPLATAKESGSRQTSLVERDCEAFSCESARSRPSRVTMCGPVSCSLRVRGATPLLASRRARRPWSLPSGRRAAPDPSGELCARLRLSGGPSWRPGTDHRSGRLRRCDDGVRDPTARLRDRNTTDRLIANAAVLRTVGLGSVAERTELSVRRMAVVAEQMRPSSHCRRSGWTPPMATGPTSRQSLPSSATNARQAPSRRMEDVWQRVHRRCYQLLATLGPVATTAQGTHCERGRLADRRPDD